MPVDVLAGDVRRQSTAVGKGRLSSWPVASFRVDDVHATVRGFRAAGVAFLGPDDLPFAVDADGISTDTTGLQVAWLKDPDGNVLTVFQLG